MNVTRVWNELVATLADATPGGVICLALTLLLIAAGVAILWYTWPPRLPFLGRRDGSGRSDRQRGRRRFQWPKWRWRLRWRRRRRRATSQDLDELAPDELPDLPAEVLALTADQLAAAGRYAEAVRERLRAMVRELIEREAIEHHPGWTVTELAAHAGQARPVTAPALRGAATIFSEIWYGQRPATVDDDRTMRGYAGAVHEAVKVPA